MLRRSRKSGVPLVVPNHISQSRRRCTATYKWTDEKFQGEHIRLGKEEDLKEKRLTRIRAVKVMCSASFWSASDRSFPTGRKSRSFPDGRKSHLGRCTF